jgi:hypothetical protein
VLVLSQLHVGHRGTHRAIHLKVLLIFSKLKSDPDGFAVAIAMPGGELVNGLLGLAASVEPSGALGDEEAEEGDQARENHLQPDRDQPRGVALDIQAATGGARGQDGTNKPGGVAKTGDHTTITGVGSLNDPDGTGGGGDGDTETCEEAATHELALRSIAHSGALDDSSSNDEHAADEHADAATPLIDGRTDEWKGTDSTNLVHGGDKTGPDTLVFAVEVLKEILLVGHETTKQHGVETVHRLAEEADEQDEEKEEGTRVGQLDRLLQQGLVEGFTALDLPDFDDLESQTGKPNEESRLTSFALSMEFLCSTTSSGAPRGFSLRDMLTKGSPVFEGNERFECGSQDGADHGGGSTVLVVVARAH